MGEEFCWGKHGLRSTHTITKKVHTCAHKKHTKTCSHAQMNMRVDRSKPWLFLHLAEGTLLDDTSPDFVLPLFVTAKKLHFVFKFSLQQHCFSAIWITKQLETQSYSFFCISCLFISVQTECIKCIFSVSPVNYDDS